MTNSNENSTSCTFVNDSISKTNINQPTSQLSNIQQPLVFQCKKCFTIVGDSSKLFSAISSYRVIVLEEKSDTILVGEDPIVQPDMNAFDYMSTCFLLYCATCKETIGRSYISGNINMMHLVQKYILDTDSLQCYELGSPNPLNSTTLDIPSVLSLQKQIIQLQRFSFASRDRIQLLETKIEQLVKQVKLPRPPGRPKKSMSPDNKE